MWPMVTKIMVVYLPHCCGRGLLVCKGSSRCKCQKALTFSVCRDAPGAGDVSSEKIV